MSILFELTDWFEDGLANLYKTSKANYAKSVDREELLKILCARVPMAVTQQSLQSSLASQIGADIRDSLGIPLEDDLTNEYVLRIHGGQFFVNIMEQKGLIQTIYARMPGKRKSAYQVYCANYRDLAAMSDYATETKSWYFPLDTPFGDWCNGSLKGERLISNLNNKQFESLNNKNAPKFFEAVNKLQRIGWKINKEVLCVYETLLHDKSMDNLFEHMITDLRPRRENESEGAYRYYMKKKRGSRNGKALEHRNVLSIAKAVANLPEFFNRWYADFRGRIYPATSYLHEQGSEHTKALLEFSKGVRIGESGLYYIMLHTANSFGNDKISLNERVQFVEDNYNKFVDYANSPYENIGWMDADKPFTFLRCCIELRDIQNCSVPLEFISTLPVYIDGSNNGWQHISTITCDKEIARLVNLISDNKVPGDLYMDIWNKTKPSLEGEFSEIWSNSPSQKLMRKVCKRPVMTSVYGGTREGFANQVYDDSPNVDRYFENVSPMECKYLGHLIYDAIRGNEKKSFKSKLPAAARALKMFEKFSSEVTKDNVQVSWIVPETGFPVYQSYFGKKKKKVPVKHGDAIRELIVYWRDNSKVDRIKSKSAISPNLVHSFDAAHLQLTTIACDFDVSMVHDSFGCHAGDMKNMFKIVRRTFIDFHKTDPMIQVLSQWGLEYLMDDVRKEDFDIETIMQSDFAFA